VKDVLTVGDLARLLGQPVHRIQYLLKSRGIQAAARAGNLRVFDDSVLPLLRRALIDADSRSSKFEAPVKKRGVRP